MKKKAFAMRWPVEVSIHPEKRVRVMDEQDGTYAVRHESGTVLKRGTLPECLRYVEEMPREDAGDDFHASGCPNTGHGMFVD